MKSCDQDQIQNLCFYQQASLNIKKPGQGVGYYDQ